MVQDSPSDEKKLAKCPKTTGGVRGGNFDDAKKAERSTSEQSGDMSPRSLKESSQSIQDLQPKQDYIHVRARRGQATDSHSLAERVSNVLPLLFVITRNIWPFPIAVAERL